MIFMQELLNQILEWSILLFEYIGAGIITYAGIIGLVNYIKRNPSTRLLLAKGLAMGLEFKLGGEILRTVLVRDLNEIAIVGSIILLRAALTVLIHWEIKTEEGSENEHARKVQSALK